MPEMDGVAFVRAQMARRPVPIIIISVANGAGEQVLAALDAGAIDFRAEADRARQRPAARHGRRAGRRRSRRRRSAPMHAAGRSPSDAAAVPAPAIRPARTGRRVDIVVIGISTGGPQALKVVIPRLPPDFPVPVCIVLHMPVGYTELYAREARRDVRR